MVIHHNLRLRRAAVVLACALVAACDGAPGAATGPQAQAQSARPQPLHPPVQAAEDIDGVQQRLAGSWLRDDDEDGARVRRVLVLEPGGRFAETSKATQADAVLAQHSHSGDWMFDGTNLKRRYTLIDGRQPSAPTFPYAAFEIRFESRNVFIGTDNIRKRQVRYQRVADGTLP